MVETTISVIKADIGSLAGHVVVPDFIFEIARKSLKEAVAKKIINDFHVTNAGDDLELIMTHHKGENNEEVHQLAWDTFMKGTKKAREMKIYAAGQDILSDTFSGNVKGMGPGSAEMTIDERKSEPIAIFCADKTEPGAFNYPLFKMFADPFTTAGLIPSGRESELEWSITEVTEGAFSINTLSLKRGGSACVITVPIEMKEAVERILSALQYEAFTIPEGPEGKPEDIAQEATEKIRTTKIPLANGRPAIRAQANRGVRTSEQEGALGP